MREYHLRPILHINISRLEADFPCDRFVEKKRLAAFFIDLVPPRLCVVGVGTVRHA